MNLPLLNRKLHLETPEQVADGVGGYATTWTAIGTLWAEITPGTGRTRGSGEVEMSRVPLKITVRAAPINAQGRPRAGQRFAEGSRRYAILAVTERDPMCRFLTCHAEEEVAA